MGLIERAVGNDTSAIEDAFALVNEFLQDIDDRDGRRILYRRFDDMRRRDFPEGR